MERSTSRAKPARLASKGRFLPARAGPAVAGAQAVVLPRSSRAEASRSAQRAAFSATAAPVERVVLPAPLRAGAQESAAPAASVSSVPPTARKVAIAPQAVQAE